MKCPVCQQDSTLKYQPFCSKRCADIDLNRWFNGEYIIPSEKNENNETLNELVIQGTKN
ncbi:MAG: DNA gyrase inhibitor YacG [Rhodobacteraceae bacterium]|nr:DNA gyrase inhibitor YacG [Paracoccaceae bacterium]